MLVIFSYHNIVFTAIFYALNFGVSVRAIKIAFTHNDGTVGEYVCVYDLRESGKVVLKKFIWLVNGICYIGYRISHELSGFSEVWAR